MTSRGQEWILFFLRFDEAVKTSARSFGSLYFSKAGEYYSRNCRETYIYNDVYENCAFISRFYTPFSSFLLSLFFSLFSRATRSFLIRQILGSNRRIHEDSRRARVWKRDVFAGINFIIGSACYRYRYTRVIFIKQHLTTAFILLTCCNFSNRINLLITQHYGPLCAPSPTPAHYTFYITWRTINSDVKLPRFQCITIRVR